MFLKSLTLRGFKSFADKTVLELEPGITVIVGPNGSGKSNVVDAISWVLGEQGAKALRGGKMDDVIFSGAGARGPLGRAEVTLTIDNSAGLLPIDYAEVSISRLLYRTGESEYAINATPCRLLDIQELLSDTGVGRELHTIIGQGNLDSVLHGRPEDRRAAIEEAAGISKHRRRKDRALRKLAGVEQQLVRLSDLVAEMRRQLKPLQQQAEAAQRAAEVQAELREVKLTLRARELAAARAQAHDAAADAATLATRLAEFEATHAAAQAAEQQAQARLATDEPHAAAAGETVHRLDTVRERLRGTLALATERARGLSQPLADDQDGRSPEDMLREADEAADQLATVDAELEALRDAVRDAEAGRDAARASLIAHDRRVADAERARARAREQALAAEAEAERARARARERVLRLQADAASLRQELDRHASELARLYQRDRDLAARVAEAQARIDGLTAEATRLAEDEKRLVELLGKARGAREDAAARVDTVAKEQRRLVAERAAAHGRQEAHEAVARAAGADVLAALGETLPGGLLGPVAPALTVDEGYEAAVAAALGADAAAVLVDGPETAVAAVAYLHDAGTGRATLLFTGDDDAAGAARGAGTHAEPQPAPHAASHAPSRATSQTGAASDADSTPPAAPDADPTSPAASRATSRADDASTPAATPLADADDEDAAATPATAGIASTGTAATSPATRDVSAGDGPAPPFLRAHVRPVGAGGATAASLLDGVLIAEDRAEARELLARHPGHRVVTRAGELFAAGRVEGGAAPEAGALAARRAARDAAAAVDTAAAALAGLDAAADAAAAALAAVQEEVDEATAARNAAASVIDAVADQLGRATDEHRALERERRALTSRRADLDGTRARDAARLATLDERLEGAHAAVAELESRDEAAVAQPGPEDEDPSLDEAGRESLATAVEQAVEQALVIRERLSAVTERRRLLAGRESGLRERAAAAAEAATRRARLRAARLAGAERATDAARLAGRVLARLERSLAAATARRDDLTAAVDATRQELLQATEHRLNAGRELERLQARAREVDAASLQARLHDEDLARRMVEEFGTTPADVIAEYAVDPADATSLPEGDPRRLPDTELRRSSAALERRLALIGRVNPLALEDFKALEERHAFLAGQLADLKDSRRDLLRVVRAVDARVREVFGEAFADVAREFNRTFNLLFPGGEGRLVLTDPEDLLVTGVEIEARPPGKRLRRLSLLSGGERSLVALAFCFAIFRARPSPFYVLDEVEAALDDVNLQRFLTLLDDIRNDAQLLVVSHQRRTMEAADALYGVSMRAGGVSKVISQRLRASSSNRRRGDDPVAVAGLADEEMGRPDLAS